MNKNKLFILVFLIMKNSLAAEFGKAVLSGAGCSQREVPQIGIGVNVIPIKISIEKEANQEFSRISCNLRLPIKLNKDEMLKIVSGGADYDVELEKNSADISLFVGLGGKNERAAQALIMKSDRATINAPKNESLCGKDAMLKINFSATISGKGKASLNTGDLKLEIKTTKCN